MAIEVTDALAKGVQLNFVKHYEPEIENVESMIGPVMQLNVGSDGLFENYAYWTSPLHPEHRSRSEAARDGLIEAVGYQVRNLDWKRSILWHINDEEDDRTNYIRTRAGQLAQNWAWLPARISFQMMSNTTDPLLLPSIPLAPDGAAMFSTTDGAGDPRFGVSGGNIESGHTLNSEAGFEEAYLAAKRRLLQFRDTHGVAPLNQDSSLNKGLVLYYSRENEEVVTAALHRKFRAVEVTSAAGAGAESNIFIDGDTKVTPVGTVFLEGTDFYLGVKEPKIKPLFQQTRRKVQMLPQTRENSDDGRHRGLVGFVLDSREGYGMNLPYQIVKATA